MKKISMFRNFFPAVIGIVLLAGSFVHAQQIDGKGAVTLAPTSGTQTVKVVNTSAEPVPMRDVDNPARHPFRQTLSATWDDGYYFAITSQFTVPAGKRLVIKYASCYIELPTGQFTTFNLSNQDFQYTFMVNKLGTVGSRDELIASQPMELYLDASIPNQLVFVRSNSTGSGQANVTISGYLVDVP